MKLQAPKSVFIDADAFICLLKQDETNRKKAWEIYRDFRRNKTAILCTNQIALFEAATVLSQRASHKVATRFLDSFVGQEALATILPLSPAIYTEATRRFSKQTSKNVSLFDCLHMACCSANDIKNIFSFDKAYRTNGFNLVTD